MTDNDEELLSVLGETIHTAFRKGTDAPGSHAVWLAIARPDSGFRDAVGWVLWCLREMRYDIVRRADRTEDDE